MNPTDYLPNAPASEGNTYYVAQNVPRASDDNPGTEELPLRTVSKAASVVDQCDTVVIDEGALREEVSLPG